jgi:Nucleotidyl transferase AbiEii toxin, Type IV TA system
MPRHAENKKNVPALVENFAVQKADGADLALEFPKLIQLNGMMPGGGKNTVEIAVASIPALLVMKGYAIAQRKKEKDAYDIYYCIRNYPGGHKALAADCKPLLERENAKKGYQCIAEKFKGQEEFGPTSVRKFVEQTNILGERTADQWQTDAFGQVQAWLKELGLA